MSQSRIAFIEVDKSLLTYTISLASIFELTKRLKHYCFGRNLNTYDEKFGRHKNISDDYKIV